MPHASFDIIGQVQESGHADLHALRDFRENVWNMRVWLPATNTPAPNEQTKTTFHMDEGVDGDWPTLSVYLNEADASAAAGRDGYIASRFCFLQGLADANRINALLVDGEQELTLAHAALLSLRDLATLGEQNIPMDANEVAALRRAVELFAAEALDYCAAQPDVQRLHLAVMGTNGIKACLGGALSASNCSRHIAALEELNLQFFRPGWRFLLFEDNFDAAPLVAEMKALAPIYDQRLKLGWWSRVKLRFNAPPVGMVFYKVDGLDEAQPQAASEQDDGA
ncbi:hypothetical protein AAKU55_005381 [Oxalobacteraceae bacterium GrIS 1.11]